MRRVLLGCILLAVLCAGCDTSRSGKETIVAITVAPTISPTANAPASAPIATSTIAVVPTMPALSATSAIATSSAASLDRLNNAERTWQASGVMRYRIRVRHGAEANVDGIWEVTVENGRITSRDCSAPPPSGDTRACSILPAEDVTVAGLFQYTRQAINDPSLNVTAKYDTTYGFPRSVVRELRNSTGWSETTVVDFVVLP
jgi:hypothetical protein